MPSVSELFRRLGPGCRLRLPLWPDGAYLLILGRPGGQANPHARQFGPPGAACSPVNNVVPCPDSPEWEEYRGAPSPQERRYVR